MCNRFKTALMNKQLLFFFFIVLSMLAACNRGNRKFVVNGKIAGMPEQTVILEQINVSNITIIDSGHSDKNGKFELSGTSPEPGLYRLHFTSGKYILLTIDNGQVDVTAGWDAIEQYSVKGSEASVSLQKFLSTISERMNDINTLSVVIDTLQAHGKDSLINVAKKELQDTQLKITELIEHYADTNLFEPNAIFAARMLNAAAEYNYLDAFSQTLSRRFSGTQMTRDYMEYYARVSTKLHQPKPVTGKIDAGSVAPEITLPAPDGKTVSLSSLKGKYVLIEFWAGWNKVCRDENPKIVAAYQKYKDKNFTVFGVSLDNKKEDWEKAIKDDKLEWANCSDLKGMNADIAKAYGVTTIPYNFLIDPTGKVVARDLTGNELEAMLSRIVK